MMKGILTKTESITVGVLLAERVRIENAHKEVEEALAEYLRSVAQRLGLPIEKLRLVQEGNQLAVIADDMEEKDGPGADSSKAVGSSNGGQE